MSKDNLLPISKKDPSASYSTLWKDNEFQKFVKVIDHKTKSYQFKDLDNELCIQEEEGDRLFMSNNLCSIWSNPR